MNNHDYIPQEAYFPLSVLFAALGTILNTWGMNSVLESRNNNPAMRELGERQLRAGGYFIFLAEYIKNGILLGSEVMDQLIAQWVQLHTATD